MPIRAVLGSCMALPKEICNKIYTYVFHGDIEIVREPIRYDWDVEAVVADAPIRVPLDQSPPQSKETILSCRQLYEEMIGRPVLY